MSLTLKLQQFSGPLDVLLALIEEKRMPITDLSISAVTEQYLQHVEKLDAINPEELADFLGIATKLVLYKSKLLLPQFFPEEEEDEQSLQEQLRRYKLFVDVSKHVSGLWTKKRYSVFRVEPPKKQHEFVPPQKTTQDTMHKSMVQLLRRLAPLKPLPQVTVHKTISVKEKIQTIRQLLKKVKTVHFHDIVSSKKNKSEIIIGFLAVLELVKQQHIALSQNTSFSDIVISPAKQ